MQAWRSYATSIKFDLRKKVARLPAYLPARQPLHLNICVSDDDDDGGERAVSVTCMHVMVAAAQEEVFLM